MKESDFQHKFICRIKECFPECICMKNDAKYIQGIPDFTVLFENKYVLLEFKRSSNASVRPNQNYYINKHKNLSSPCGFFVSPENADLVFSIIYYYFTDNQPYDIN